VAVRLRRRKGTPVLTGRTVSDLTKERIAKVTESREWRGRKGRKRAPKDYAGNQRMS